MNRFIYSTNGYVEEAVELLAVIEGFVRVSSPSKVLRKSFVVSSEPVTVTRRLSSSPSEQVYPSCNVIPSETRVYPAEEDVYSAAEIVFELIFVIVNVFDADVPEEDLEVEITPFVISDAPPLDISVVV